MVRIKSSRAVLALVAAGLICGAGLWLFLANIHGQSTQISAVLRWAFPTVALAERFGFFGSSVVYWASLVLGFLLWTLVAYWFLSLLAGRSRRA